MSEAANESPMRGRPSAPPRRIVSLVPSLTEALFALDLGERVVGVTEWCVHPAQAVARVRKIGGTKNPDLEAIRALAPDLVIANQEENRRRDVERLEAAGIPVWVTYPCTVREGAELFAELAQLGASAEARARVVAPVLRAVAEAETALVALRASGATPPRVFCPIWRDPWMAVGAPTYSDDLITLCGGVNVFGLESHNRLLIPVHSVERTGEASERASESGARLAEPAGRARRYPRVTLAEVEAAQPDIVLLPDEPYAFGPRDAAELARLEAPSAASGRIHLIDGTFVSWYGPRILRAIELLRRLLLDAARG